MIGNNSKVIILLLFVGLAATVFLVSDLIQFPYNKVETLEGTVNLEVGKPVYLQLPKLKDKDRVMVNLQTLATVGIRAFQNGEEVGVLPVVVEGAKYSLVDYLVNDQKGLFIAKEGEVNQLVLQALFPLTQYHIIFPFENTEGKGEMEISQAETDGSRMINTTIEGNSALFVYPVDLTVNKDFAVRIRVSSSPEDATVRLNIMSDTDNTLYNYEVIPNCSNFEVNVTTDEIYKRGTILGDRISSVSLTITPNSPDKAAIVLLGDMEIVNAGNKTAVNTSVQKSFEVPYEVYIANKYTPDLEAIVSWLLISTAIITTWFLVHRKL